MMKYKYLNDATEGCSWCKKEDCDCNELCPCCNQRICVDNR